MLRIISGQWRGRRLKTLPGPHTRPTAERMREALFSILGAQVSGARVLDLFAGSGALGLEALSRGARDCVLVDNDPGALKVLRENAAMLGAGRQAKILNLDLASGKLPSAVWDLILADPPYEQGWGDKILDMCAQNLAGGGLLVLEHSPKEKLNPGPAWQLQDHRAYGRGRLSFFHPAEDAA